jgi:translation initiation factor 1A
MPKNQKKGKNSKNGSTVEKRLLVEADLEGQIYGILCNPLGMRFFNVTCADGVTRRCKIRKKRMRCSEGDFVIVSLREFDNFNGDVIHRFNIDEARDLQKCGKMPLFDKKVESGTNISVEDDGEFFFEDI